jgi:signal transduction histidine kinase
MSPAESNQQSSEAEKLQIALAAETHMRREAEDRLCRANQEFEDFILHAAHDLREPLRTVSAYGDLLSRKDVPRTEAEADQYRRYIGEGSTRIQALVSAMVDYVTAPSKSGYHLPVDMNEVFRDAEAALAPSGLKRAAITREPLPIVKGDSEKLVKVCRHLLDNAVRYCEADEPRIHISAHEEDCEWLFSVRDNGPGIEEAYREKVFEPFKRLHGRQYAGSGLGLSFCRRVVESLGGRIWVESGSAESKPGQGSTFIFTLPIGD